MISRAAVQGYLKASDAVLEFVAVMMKGEGFFCCASPLLNPAFLARSDGRLTIVTGKALKNTLEVFGPV
jgi:hypothetical protein